MAVPTGPPILYFVFFTRQARTPASLTHSISHNSRLWSVSRWPTKWKARTMGDSDALNDPKELLSLIFVAGVLWAVATLVAWR